MVLPIFSNINHIKGSLESAGDQSSFNYLLQPTLPFELSESVKLFIRPAIPILFNQPVYTGDAFESSGFNLGNISADLSVGGTTKTGLIWLTGAFFTLPTASDERIRVNFSIGPEAAIGFYKQKLIGLILLSQSWDVSGENKTSNLGSQYALARPLKNGWMLLMTPPFSYNWDSKELTLPVGMGPYKTTKIGNTPVQLGTQFWYFVSQPNSFGPSW